MDKLDAELKFGQEALNLRAYRQQILSSNIANADTPDYKARDLNFSQALTGALARSGMSTGVNSGTLAMAAPSSGVAASPGGVTLATDAGGKWPVGKVPAAALAITTAHCCTVIQSS